MIQRCLVALGFVAIACTTNVTDNAPLPLGSSTILASATATAALLIDATDVTWLTADGAIHSCTKANCQPHSVATNYEALGLNFSGSNSSAVLAQGAVYFIASGVLQSCLLSGCSTPTVIGKATGARVVTDGDWLAYDGAGGLTVCSLPSCASPTVVEAAGTVIGINDFALANGVLSFLSSSVVPGAQENLDSLQYCPAAACPSGVKTAWQEMVPSTDQPPFDAIVGANVGSVFVTNFMGGELLRCDLPTCANPVDMGVQAAAGSMAIFSGADIYVASTSFYANGPASWMHCSVEQCDSSPIPYPDPVLAALCPAPSATQFGTLPFAVDAVNFYWATSSIYKSPGNFIVSTAR